MILIKKLTIIYWSNGGNVEVLANHIASGAKEAGAQVLIKLVSEATVEDVATADAVAFGSPSMDNNKIEQHEMQPYICLLYTSDAADDLTRVDLGGRRIIKKKKKK